MKKKRPGTVPSDAESEAGRWLEENRAGFEAFARFVAQHGIFNEADREW